VGSPYRQDGLTDLVEHLRISGSAHACARNFGLFPHAGARAGFGSDLGYGWGYQKPPALPQPQILL
jgi:hypothetical protein